MNVLKKYGYLDMFYLVDIYFSYEISVLFS
jgi:hypothetical protein